jgi:outer membrane protein OmpA-like peptidoglycan-associated protein
MNRILILTAALSLFCASQSHAEPVYYGPGQVPKPIDVARALAGKSYQPTVRMRGMDMGPANAEPMVLGQTESTPAAAPEAPAEGLDVAINFAFDSHQLLPSAFAVLDSLAEGIKLTDASKRVLIMGHTDAVGGEGYNLQLSERRANVVRDYLIQQHGISAARLQSFGRGEGALLVPEAPNSAMNRRVGFALS